MAESWDGSCDTGSQSEDSYHFDRLHIEPIYDSFMCPLTKKVMRDPVTIENGHTFEREDIEKWFKECRENGRRPVCPLSNKELNSTHLNPSIALRNTIEEWTARNDSVQLDIARRSLSLASSENDIMHALSYVHHICQTGRSNRNVVQDMISMILNMLKNSSRKVRCKALETLRIIVEDDSENKEIMSKGDTVRTIVKLLSHELSKEKEQAISLLYELSKSEALCEKIGSINGAILILIGMASSMSENDHTVENAEKTLKNLVRCETNVHQMAENGRLQPLLTLLLEGTPETKQSMAICLGDLTLSNDVKVSVAQTVGCSLINFMRSGNLQSREAALKALNQISSCESSAKVLIESGILAPLVDDLLSSGSIQMPTRLKEMSATILANVVNSGHDFASVQVGPDRETLVSENIVHNLLYLISNTGPAIEGKLLQVLVGLTSLPMIVSRVVSAIKSSGATISLVQFIEAPQKDLRLTAIRLLQNLSPHMGHDLADAIRGTAGQLGSLIGVILENIFVSDEQTAAVKLLADLPERNLGLTKQMLNEGTFELIVSKVSSIRPGEAKNSRFLNSYFDGLVRVLARVTFVLDELSEAVPFCQTHDLAALFTSLLSKGHHVQMISAVALENLSYQSKKLTRRKSLPAPGFWGSLCSCLAKTHGADGICRVHGGVCSMKESFCLLEGQAIDKLAGLLDHENEKVVEASLAALSTLLEDGVDVEKGVLALCEADVIEDILCVFLEARSENIRRRAVWVIERMLRTEEIAFRVSSNPNVSTLLVNAFQNADERTRQIAEHALQHIHRLPKFSEIFSKPVAMGT